ncbi:MAG TPA: hypothetical protein VFR55_08360 [Dehalococcoidia bacterium]|nr:hypothetical protein [Dehalococcoidia bacterium]
MNHPFDSETMPDLRPIPAAAACLPVSCRHCGGILRSERDQYGHRLVCWLCGREHLLSVTPPPRPYNSRRYP